MFMSYGILLFSQLVTAVAALHRRPNLQTFCLPGTAMQYRSKRAVPRGQVAHHRPRGVAGFAGNLPILIVLYLFYTWAISLPDA